MQLSGDKNPKQISKQSITTREGRKVNISGDKWHLPYINYDNSSIDFGRIKSELIKNSLKRYVSHTLVHTSTNAGLVNFTVVLSEILKFHNTEVKDNNLDEETLIKAFEKAINLAKSEHRLWALYRPIKWYIWSSKNSPELGFSKQYAEQLSTMSIPGNPKGQAVRMDNPEYGPLNRSLELPLVIEALKNDKSSEFLHLQQKAALALSVALGRNPGNLIYLRESDLSQLTPFDKDEPTYILKVPRIKKRQLSPRDDFIEEYLDPYFGKIIEDLIAANKGIDLVYAGRKYIKLDERPLFIKVSGNKSAKRSHSIDEVFNLVSNDISKLLKSFVKRHNIISPLTGLPLKVSPRRFRYTLATGLASEGISSKELARILDHTDTQHVMVYYDTKSSIVAHLDKALSKQFAQYVSLFKGKVIDNDSDAVNGCRDDKHLLFVDEDCPDEQTNIGVCGELTICYLDPPFSCYLCPKFQPYRTADHEYVLDKLIDSREKRFEKYENARLGIQLDDVILAVSNVIEICRKI
ncbi:integrase [Psychrobacter sp. PL19]|uniref:tyrosine-type recombinase/integrase n=1 Tax=Psychrobacter sp. PL19 TaxID=2760711 RepID=UPI001AE39F07